MYTYIVLYTYIHIYIYKYFCLSCAIYTHTPARTSSTNFQLCYFAILLYEFVLQTGLGLGMGINGTAHI